MKKHIMKLVAVVMTAVMVLSLVPVAALPEVNWPELLSVFGASSSATVEKEEAGEAAPENGEAAPESGDASAAPENGADDTAGEVQSTDALTPSSTDGYYFDESGNIYADNDGDGTAELVKADVVEGDNDVDIADLIGAVEQGKVTDDKDYNIDNTADISSVDTYLQWSQTYSSLNATKVGNYAAGTDGNLIHAADASTSPYEPWETEDEDHPFLPNNQAWIDLSEIYYGAPASPTYPFTKWSSNTPFLASSIEYDANGNKIGTVFPDVDLIHEGIWSTQNYQSSFDATNGIAYNRYDPQQDKWGITLDRNIDNEYVEWNANKTFNLAETPYLEYSTEQVDGQQLAICLQIGTPKSGGGYDYRWYTVTDSLPRPGIKGDDRATTTMEPAVMISAVGASNPVLTAQNVKVALGSDTTTTKTVSNTGYVDGAVSACIDMVQWLPLVEGAQQEYRVNRVRIYTKSASDKKFAARVNFLYFVNQAANFLLPMSDTGMIDVSNKGAAVAADYRNSAVSDNADGAKSYNNGWINAAAITKMDMTVNHTYNMEVDSSVSGLDSFSSGGKEYVMVQIPIRKWANTSWDARRLQISIDVDDDGASHRPAFLFLGNNTGTNKGASNVNASGFDDNVDGMLGVFGGVNKAGTAGVTPYCIGGNTPGAADYQQAQGLVYNGYASYFDWLYNGYIENERTSKDLILNDGTVQADASYGWVYISYVQMVMEKGTKMTVYMINNRNVSDALNNKDNNGDGGSGKQPQVQMTNGFGYTEEPAAQGPFIDSSTYQSVDLLGKAGRGKEKMGKGIWFTASSDSYKSIYSNPTNLSGSVLVSGTKNSTKILVMGIARGDSYDMGLGLYESSGTYKLGWVVLWTANQSTKYWTPTDGTGYMPNSQTSYATDEMSFDGDKGDTNWVFTSTGSFSKYTTCQNELLAVLSAGPVFSGGSANDGDALPKLQTLSSKTIVVPDVANTYWNGCNGRVARSNITKEDANGTDTKTKIWIRLGDQQYYYKTTELLDSAVTVKKSQNPYLYYDLEYAIGAAHLGLLIKYSSTYDMIYVNAAKNTVTTASEGVTKNTGSMNQSGSIDLTSVFTSLGVSSFDIIGIWQQSWYGTGYDGRTFEHILRHLEIRYSEDQWRDVVKMDGNKMIDNVDIIGDALNYTRYDGSKTLTTSYGPKGWAVTGIPDDSGMKKPNYYPQLSHLRFHVPNNTKADGDRITFTSRGSYSVKDYKYLYLSVAMVDGKTGIAVEDRASQGFSIRLNNYYNHGSGFFITESGLTSSVAYTTRTNYLHRSLNVALDLEALGKFSSWNQIVFYFQNTCDYDTDFHINYCYLSNTPPEQEYIDEISRPFYHAYYLMDASGDRYSTRFPTEYNPTGQVSTATGKTGRVNPMIVERTKRFYQGKLYNGYAMTGGSNSTDKLKKVWFYDYSTPPSGYKNISVYYKRAGYGDEGDMSWQYGRWGSSTSRLDYDKSASTVNGDMLSLYATANQVLLRSGLEPIKYRTVFDTQGGQMVYGDNSFGIDVGLGGLYENENNIYNTEAVILSYYDWPTTDDLRVDPVKYGYDFKGWYPVKQDDKNASSAEPLLLYDRRETDGIHYFYAWWTPKPANEKLPNSNETWGTVKNTVTFLDGSGKEWFSRDAMQSNGFIVKLPNVSSIVIGNAAKVLAGWQAVPVGETKPAVTADTFLYTAGTIVTVTKDYTFYPVTLDDWNAATNNATQVNAPHTFSVYGGGKLYAKSAQTGNWFEITATSLPGVKVTTSGTTRTYTNIPHLALIKLKATSAKADYCWWANFHIASPSYSVVNTGNNTSKLYSATIASYNSEFTFSAYTDISFTYQTQATGGSWTDHEQRDANGALIYTAPSVHVYNEGENRQMVFTSQYELPSGATALEAGTLYTQSRQFDNIIAPSQLTGLSVGSNDYNKTVANAFGNAMKFTDSNGANALTNHSLPTAVRYLKATTVNSSNQYYMMVTLSKYKENTYYARGYVIYQYNGTKYVTYSDIIAVGTLTAES